MVLTHGERGADGLSLGREDAAHQGLELSAELHSKPACKIAHVHLKWQPAKVPPANCFLPPTTPF